MLANRSRLQGIVILLIAAAITLAVQSAAAILNLEGDKSLEYFLTCLAIVIANSFFLLHLKPHGWRQLFNLAASGFFMGGCIGFFVLLVAGKIIGISGVTFLELWHPNFGLLLIEFWCLFTAIFGMVFNCVFWVINHFAALAL